MKRQIWTAGQFVLIIAPNKNPVWDLQVLGRIRKEIVMVNVLDEEMPSDKPDVFLTSYEGGLLTWL